MNRRIHCCVFHLIGLVTLSTACTTYFDTPTSPTPTPLDPSVFTGQVVRGGSASRDFDVATAGAIQVTLTSMIPEIRMGLGIGIPRPDGGGCNLSKSVDTSPSSSPQLTVPTDAGRYCVKIYDIGHINDTATFSITVKPS